VCPLQHRLRARATAGTGVAVVHLAAALALANQRADRALELLELWRQIRYDQMLGLRSDLTDLGERHPNLADRVTRLRGLFDSPAPDGQEGADIRESAGERRRLGESWQSLLTEVRALPGFSRFAMPPSAQELAAEAAHGAIAVPWRTREDRPRGRPRRVVTSKPRRCAETSDCYRGGPANGANCHSARLMPRRMTSTPLSRRAGSVTFHLNSV
jgi:hypothetical protein